MYAIPGLVVGLWYAGAMLILSLILGRTKRFRGRITPAAYLRVSMFLTLIVCMFIITVDGEQNPKGRLIFFFIGFQIIVILTSYFPPEEQHSAGEHRD